MKKLKDFVKQNKLLLIFTAVIWLLFMVLIYLAPYSGDDWPWGSEVGDWRLKTWFADYNGRYAGNLLVLLLSRVEALQVLVISLSMLAICFLPLLFDKKISVSMLAVCTLLLILMPHSIFVQSIMWTSGFTNYIPPIILTLVYVVMVKGVFDSTAPSYSLKQHIVFSVISALLGFVGAFFMENVTIYNVMVGAFVIVLTLVKFKKAYLIHISYLVSSIVGLMLMFSNGAYKKAANGTDFYRGFASFKDLDVIFNHLDFICKRFFLENFLVLTIISVLCVLLLFKNIKGTKEKKSLILLNTALYTNIVTLVIMVFLHIFRSKLSFFDGGAAPTAVLGAIAVLYCLSVLLTVIFTVKDSVLKAKLLFLLISVPLLVGPFLLISPLNARCLVPAFIVLIVFAAMLYGYVRRDLSFNDVTVKAVTVSACAVALGMLTFFFCIYSVVHRYEKMRVEYIEKQVECGITEDVVFTHLPCKGYVWMESPGNENWANRFKSFYGIDKKIKFKYVSVEEFDKWRLEFDKNEVTK